MNEVTLNKLKSAVKYKFGVERVHVVGLESFYKNLTFGQQNEPGFISSDTIAVYYDGKSDSAIMGVNNLLTDRDVYWFVVNRLQ